MRPTKYKEEYADIVMNLMYEGASIVEVCHELKICKQTFYNWCKEHDMFLDSKKRGVDFSEGWWCKQGRIQLENKEFNSTLFYMNMKNRFGWADKVESKTDVSLNKPEPLQFTSPED